MPSKWDKKIILLLLSFFVIGLLMKILGPEKKLDSLFFYTGKEADLFFKQLSDANQKSYVLVEIIDYFFMLSYSWIFYLGFKKFFFATPVTILSFIPGLLDVAETSMILLRLSEEEVFFNLNYLAAISFFKWISVCIVLVVLLIKFCFFYRK